MANGIKTEELDKLFHLADELHGRAVPLLPVYDPEYDGDKVPDWADDPDWFMWVEQQGELHALDGFPAEGGYFAKEPANEGDILFPFVHFYNQHASWPDLMGILKQIEDDIRNLAACISKIALYQYLSDVSKLDTRRFVVSELEYIISVCRSLYDHLQFIAQKSWEKVQLKEGQKNQLPSSFADIALSGEEPVPAEELVEKYGLSSSLAEFYEAEAADFATIRGFRDKIIHTGETFELIFNTDEGFSVQSHLEPFASFDVWDEENFLENDLAPLWPPLAYLIHNTLRSMNNFYQALGSEIAFPPEIAPNYNVYMTGYYVQNLGLLNELMNEDVWGDQIVSQIAEEMDFESDE